MIYSTFEVIHIKVTLGEEISTWVEISSRLDSKLFFKMALQLHLKIPTRYSELNFQLGLAKLGFNQG